MLLRNALDNIVLKQRRGVLRMLKAQLKETQRTKRRVRCDSKSLLLRIVDQPGLGEIGVVLDLESGGTDTRIPQQIHQQLGAEVANTNAAGELLVDQGLHCSPGLLDRGVAQFKLAVCVHPAWRVAHTRVDVFQGNREVHDEQVEVVHAPVGQLLAADGLDLRTVVEGVPQLGDDE